jgi:hypothetical protein
MAGVRDRLGRQKKVTQETQMQRDKYTHNTLSYLAKSHFLSYSVINNETSGENEEQ